MSVSRVKWLWPTAILFSIIAVALVTFVFPGVPVRPVVVMWFLFVCPGMVVVRLFLSTEPVVTWTLAFALSFSIDAIVAGIQVYTRHWLPSETLIILMLFCLVGVIMQAARLKVRYHAAEV